MMKIIVHIHWFVIKIKLEYDIQGSTVLRYILKINVNYHYFLHLPRRLLNLIVKGVN